MDRDVFEHCICLYTMVYGSPSHENPACDNKLDCTIITHSINIIHLDRGSHRREIGYISTRSCCDADVLAHGQFVRKSRVFQKAKGATLAITHSITAMGCRSIEPKTRRTYMLVTAWVWTKKTGVG
jgi:hypothetical protein